MQNSSFVAPLHAEKRAESLDDLMCTCDVLCVEEPGYETTKFQDSINFSWNTDKMELIQILAETNSREVDKNAFVCST